MTDACAMTVALLCKHRAKKEKASTRVKDRRKKASKQESKEGKQKRKEGETERIIT